MDDQFYYIVGRESCPYCVKAKDLLESKQISYKFRDLSSNRRLMLEYVERYKWDTVPMVFYFSKEDPPEFIGGFTDLSKRLKTQ